MNLKKTTIIASIFISIISIAIIIYKFAPGFFLILVIDEIQKDIWNDKNRIILGEVYSPDSTKKLGYYHYDEGASGYTITCISLINKNDKYPLKGNIAQVNSIPIVLWKSNNCLQVTIDTTGLYGPFPNTLRLNSVHINIIKTGKSNS